MDHDAEPSASGYFYWARVGYLFPGGETVAVHYRDSSRNRSVHAWLSCRNFISAEINADMAAWGSEKSDAPRWFVENIVDGPRIAMMGKGHAVPTPLVVKIRCRSPPLHTHSGVSV